jgi:hypothetical protein
LLANGVAIFAKVEGNTMIENDAPEKLKHFSAHVAMLPQSSMAHGFALCGQQSPSIADMSVPDIAAGSGDLELTPAPTAAGSIATDRAISRARIVRPIRMDRACEDN